MIAILAVIAMVASMVGCATTNDLVNESSTKETYVDATTLHLISTTQKRVTTMQW
jgi:hypothetical protein